MDPRSGAILAMANVPTYDPNAYSRYPVEARRNRAVTDTFPPGSSCKPFVASGALEAGVVKWGDVIYCENGYWAEHRLHDAGHSYGNLKFEEGIEKSSNIMMGKLGVRLGNERLHDALTAFGFGRRTGVWLPGESNGLVFPLRRWTKLSTTRVAFGQEFTVTPLQLITAFAAIANDGKLVRPKILRGVLDSRGQTVADLSDPEPVGHAIDTRTARQMIDRALVGVIEEGTGKACQIPGYRVFGKTGTAQKIDPGTKAVSHTRYMGSFLAGVPAQNPQIVALVMVDEPDKSIGYYGGTVAAPAVKKILEQAIPYLGIPPAESATERPESHLVRHDVTD
jgi:cell division protein FtsI (penicillin-binding protein 3)